MKHTHRLLGSAAALLLMFAVSTAPAKAQFAGFGGGGSGGDDMMTQMAPMLEMMKAKMGKKRFGAMMQTMGPMMSNMMDGSGGGMGGFGGGGFGGGMGSGLGPFTSGASFSNGIGGFGGTEMMAMIPQLMSLANMGGTRRHRKH